jgi:hypothetical protein
MASGRAVVGEVFYVEDPDAAWTPYLVEKIYDKNPVSDAFTSKDHYLDQHVRLSGPRDEIACCCACLQEEIRRLVCNADEGDPRVGTIELSNVTAAFANMVRKALMTRVTVYAVDSVAVSVNDSQYLSEQIAHRLGMLAYAVSEGAGQIAGPMGTVHVTGRTVRGRDVHFPCGSARVVPTFADTVICHLGTDEVLRVAIELGRGCALMHHDKFSALSTPSYRPHIHLQETSAQTLAAIEGAGLRVIEEPGSAKLRVVARDPSRPARKEQLEEELQSRGIVATSVLEGKSTHYTLSYRAHGQLSPQRCLDSAVATLHQEVAMLRDVCEGNKAPTVP